MVKMMNLMKNKRKIRIEKKDSKRKIKERD
jgi:hypothetical protein